MSTTIPTLASGAPATGSEVIDCRIIVRATPSLPIASVAKPCRCASFPGERASAAGSTSVKSCAASQPRIAAWMRLRATSSGRRSAWRVASHHGVSGVVWAGNGRPLAIWRGIS